jgi:hypothetical protein
VFFAMHDHIAHRLTCFKGIIAVQSVDWQSLTFSGERHQLRLRVPGPETQAIVRRLCDGLEEAEFSIRGVIVADIGLAASPEVRPDGSLELAIEALTIVED